MEEDEKDGAGEEEERLDLKVGLLTEGKAYVYVLVYFKQTSCLFIL